MSNYNVLYGKKIPISLFVSIGKADAKVYEPKYRFNVVKGLIWVIKNRKGYVALFHEETGKIVGYLSFISLKEPYYTQLRDGKLLDSKIPLKAVQNIDKGNVNHLYLSSIVVMPEFQKTTALARLLSATIHYQKELQKKGVHVDKVLADAVSEEGRQMCEHYHFSLIHNSEHNSKIYEKQFVI